MDIKDVPFSVVEWDKVIPEEHPGESGKAFWKVFKQGNIRVRMVEYTPGYLADHWCKKGHVILVLEGEMTTELDDGRQFVTKAGCSYQVADDDGAHRTFTKTGVKLFIVD
jgi:quercetin dioxygenase-like cupin family protein